MSSYPSIRIEGGLFGSDLLDQIVAAELPGQKAVDFGLEPRRNLTDEIAAVFADARALWGVFQNRLARLPEPEDPATSVTRDAWAIPLFVLLGWELRYNPKAYEVEGLSFAVSHRGGEPDDSPPVHIVGVRQELGRLAASGRPRLAPHSLLQEFLNRTDYVWGVVTNGRILRLLRDSSNIRRQVYLEFDLQAICEEQRFVDFSVLYRLLHRTRFPRGLADGPDCLLEKYFAHSVEQGGRVRERLRDGVEECIRILADGFLSHPENDELRRQIKDSRISAAELYKQLLRLIYRFLFLLVAEDRGLISPDALYRQHYGIGRLRRLLEKRSSFNAHSDLWSGLKVLWSVFSDEKLAAPLSVAPLNGELFAPLALDGCDISNKQLLEAFWYLANYRESPSSPVRRVNYAALDVEEMGSVYESLLEFHPIIEKDAAGRLKFELAAGSERKTTGSYYTTPELVNELVQSALVPVLFGRFTGVSAPADKERAVLSMKVCDPACGSGHFLLAAARRLGKELARIRMGEDEPSPERVRECIREVIAHCIYGVDKNPLAVDLCRVALWIESHTEGKPLTFLDHRIRWGDSLVGVFSLETLKKGIPDEAFKPTEKDDKTSAREALNKNRFEKSKDVLIEWAPRTMIREKGVEAPNPDDIPDDSPENIRRKKAAYEARHRDPAWRRDKLACDLWTAAFFQKFQPGQPAITSDAVAETLENRPIDGRISGLAEELSSLQRFFHWPLEFPDVFSGGGFDVVLSNPPWEHVELKEQEFFASRDNRIAYAPNKSERTRLIEELKTSNCSLYKEFEDSLRSFDKARYFLGNSGRNDLTGRGRINTYAVFAELSRSLVRPSGRMGIIIPSGIATDDTTKYFFQDVIKTGSLISLFDFENRKGIFQSIHRSFKFCLFTCEKKRGKDDRTRIPEFVFFAHSVSDLKEPDRRFTLSAEDIALLNPNTGNCPIFRSRADAELTKSIYRRIPILWRERTRDRPESNPWNLTFSQGLFNMASDSHHFLTAKELIADGFSREGNIFVGSSDRYLPLHEAKMLHQFDHRWATYEESPGGEIDSREVTAEEKRNPNFVVQPRYWVREDIVESAIPSFARNQKWFLGWRNICRSTDERTTIATILPKSAVGHAFLLMFLMNFKYRYKVALISCINSFIQDYIARQKIGGINMTYNIFRQLTVLPPSIFEQRVPWKQDMKLADWISNRAIELFYASWDMSPFVKDLGYDGPPYYWDENRRFELRCELDAAFFHLYLPCGTDGSWVKADNETSEQLAQLISHFPTPRAAVSYILDQFPIVRENDERCFGHYRTKERILEIYDRILLVNKKGP